MSDVLDSMRTTKNLCATHSGGQIDSCQVVDWEILLPAGGRGRGDY